MAPQKKTAPKKNASSSSAQQKNKGKQIALESPIPHFGLVVGKEVVVGPNAYFEAERNVSKITTQGRVNKIMLSHNIETETGTLIARHVFEGERSCVPL